MTDHEYEYEVMRAELLGLPPPEKVERKPPPDECEEDLNISSENVELDGEQMGKVSGGLDELNSILAMTQRKINRFKMVCGSFTNLLKIRVGKDNATTSESASLSSLNSQSESAVAQENTVKSGSTNDVAAGSTETNTSPSTSSSAPIPVVAATKKAPKANDIEGKLNAQMDVLDRMVMKAEQAEISMNQQNKQMRRFLQ